MFKTVFAMVSTAAIMLAVAQPASARICAHYCRDGVCWWDCSKIPGQTRVSQIAQTPANATPITAGQRLMGQRLLGRR